jgi:O-antigen/teichoic acid export membrane protein
VSAQTPGSVHFGVKALGISLAVSRLLRLGTTVVLAHLLAKEAFGLVTMATAAIYALSAFREVGFSQALIHREDRGPEDLERAADTTFCLLFSANLLLFIVGWFAAPWIASEFERVAGLEPILRAMLVIYLVEGFSTTPAALLQKRLDFGVISTSEVLGTLLYSATAIILAALGYGVWGLVIGQLVSRALQAAWLVRASGWRPRVRFHPAIARELFQYGKWLWASAGLQVISRSADKIVMGKVAGGATLGSYGVAFNLCTAPAKPTSNVINRLAFPALSRLREDPPALAAAYARALAMIALVAVPAAVGLAAVADEFVVTVYGRRWGDMAPLVRILAFYGLALTVGSIAGPVLLALGKPKWVTLVGAGRQVALLGLLLLLGRQGSQAVAVAVLLPALGSMTVGHWAAGRAAGCNFKQLVGPLARTALATVIMLAAVLAVEAAADPWPAAGRLVACVGTGIGVYLVATLAINRDTFEQLLSNGRSVMRAKGRLA